MSIPDMTRDTLADLAEVQRLIEVADRAMADVVATLGTMDARTVIAAEGQTLPSWLRTIAGCTTRDERTLGLVVQRLAHLPTVAGGSPTRPFRGRSSAPSCSPPGA